MPTCQECGNSKVFSSTRVGPEIPYVNSPSPLQATFQVSGEVDTIEYTGTDQTVQDQAWQRPEDYFDTCVKCGSHKLNWQ